MHRKIRNSEIPELDQKKIQGTDKPFISDLGPGDDKEYANYFAELLIGPNKFPIEVAIDLEGKDLFVKTDDCETCSGNHHYDVTALVGQKVSQVYSFGTKLSGTTANADVCLKEDHCLSNFTFVGVKE